MTGPGSTLVVSAARERALVLRGRLDLVSASAFVLWLGAFSTAHLVAGAPTVRTFVVTGVLTLGAATTAADRLLASAWTIRRCLCAIVALGAGVTLLRLLARLGHGATFGATAACLAVVLAVHLADVATARRLLRPAPVGTAR